MTERPTRLAIAIQLIALALVVVVAGAARRDGDWNLPLLGTLLVLGVASDLLRVEVRAYRIFVSASFLAIVLAAVFSGVTQAMLIGLLTILASWARERYQRDYLLINLVTYAVFPLVAGLVFEAVIERELDRARLRRLLPARLRDLRHLARDRLRARSPATRATSSARASRPRSGARSSRCCPRSSPRRCSRSRSRSPTSSSGSRRWPCSRAVILIFQYLVGALLVSQERPTSSSSAPDSSPGSRLRCSRRCCARSTCATG